MAIIELSKRSARSSEPLAIMVTGLASYFVCPVAMCLIMVGIVFGGDVGVEWLDLFYWLAAVVAVLAQYIEIRFLGEGAVADTAEALRAWRRFALRFLAVATLVWLPAHGLAHIIGR